MPDLPAEGALEVAILLSELAPENSDREAISVAAALVRNVLDGRDATHGLKRRKVTADELMRLGIPRATAYRLAADEIEPDKVLPHAFTVIQRELEAARRVRQGVSVATARRSAARRFPFPQ